MKMIIIYGKIQVSGKIDGIEGNVDTNYLYNLEIIKNEILSIEEIAQKIINGDYGNGDERKINLENEGYNYEEVQKRVNEIMNNNKYYKACTSSQNSIVDGLKEIGVDSSFASRKQIASKNGIFNYSGTASENIKLLNLLKIGKLIK